MIILTHIMRHNHRQIHWEWNVHTLYEYIIRHYIILQNAWKWPKILQMHTCTVQQTTKPKERRKVNKEVKKIITKCFMVTDCTDDSVICNKCSHKCYKIRNDEFAPFSKQTTDSVDDATFHPTAKKPKSNPAASPPSVKLSIPSTNRGHSYCFICKKPGPKLVVTPIKARFTAFLHNGVYVPAGLRCCPGHIVDGILTSDALQKIRISNDSTYFNRTSILLHRLAMFYHQLMFYPQNEGLFLANCHIIHLLNVSANMMSNHNSFTVESFVTRKL